MIMWRKKSPTEKVAELAFPGKLSNGLLAGRAWAEYVAKAELEKGQKYQATYAMHKFNHALGMQKPIDEITVKDMLKLRDGDRSQTLRMMQWSKTGRITKKAKVAEHLPSSNGVTLKIKRVGIESLISMMPVFSGGRFSTLKSKVQREITETPEGQFAVLAGTPEMINDKKERDAVQNAIKGMFTKNGTDWTVVWSNTEDSFLIMRRSDYKKVKLGGNAK